MRAAPTAAPRSPSGCPSGRTVPSGEPAVRGGCGTPAASHPAHRRPPGVGARVRRRGGAGRGVVGGRHDRARHGHGHRGGGGPGRGALPARVDACSAASSAPAWRRQRSSAAAWCVFFAGVVLLVAPAAVDQASDFSDELPATVRDLYSWPILGDRLEEADAAGEVEQTIRDLPARIDDETIADLGERLLGGALSTIVVLITAIGVLVGRRRDRPPGPGHRPPVAPGASRRGGRDRVPRLRQLLRRLAPRRRPQRPRHPHARARPRGAARADRRRCGRRSRTSSRRSVASSAARSSCSWRSRRAPSPRSSPASCSSATSSSRTTSSRPPSSAAPST